MRRRQVLALASVSAVGGAAYVLSGRNSDESDPERNGNDSERGHAGSGAAAGDGTDDEPERDDEESVLEDSEGMVVITYDDSPIEDYTLAYEVHREYDVPGCTAACPGLMEEQDAYLDPAQLREMQDDGWGVMSHTYHHRALGHIELTEPAREGDDHLYVAVNRHGAVEGDPLTIFDGETQTTATVAGRGSDASGEYIELESPLTESVGSAGFVRYSTSFIQDILQRTDDQLESWGLDVTGFVYPYGRYDGAAEDIVGEHYAAVANHGYDGHNELSGLDPTTLGRTYVETDKASEDEIDAFMETAAEEDVLSIVGGHTQFETLTADRIRYTIEAALENNLAIVTMDEALAELERVSPQTVS